jgi:hypothetical protein
MELGSSSTVGYLSQFRLSNCFPSPLQVQWVSPATTGFVEAVLTMDALDVGEPSVCVVVVVLALPTRLSVALHS